MSSFDVVPRGRDSAILVPSPSATLSGKDYVLSTADATKATSTGSVTTLIINGRPIGWDKKTTDLKRRLHLPQTLGMTLHNITDLTLNFDQSTPIYIGMLPPRLAAFDYSTFVYGPLRNAPVLIANSALPNTLHTLSVVVRRANVTLSSEIATAFSDDEERSDALDFDRCIQGARRLSQLRILRASGDRFLFAADFFFAPIGATLESFYCRSIAIKPAIAPATEATFFAPLNKLMILRLPNLATASSAGWSILFGIPRTAPLVSISATDMPIGVAERLLQHMISQTFTISGPLPCRMWQYRSNPQLQARFTRLLNERDDRRMLACAANVLPKAVLVLSHIGIGAKVTTHIITLAFPRVDPPGAIDQFVSFVLTNRTPNRRELAR